jgi:glycosyltransferase involved in cell wall biosynthesis
VAHFIYVYDNGSVDGTWDIVRDLAATYPQIIPYKREATLQPVPFARSSSRATTETERPATGDACS